MSNCLKSQRDQGSRFERGEASTGNGGKEERPESRESLLFLRETAQSFAVPKFATGELTEETGDGNPNRLCLVCPEQDTFQQSVNIYTRGGDRLWVRKVPSLQWNQRALKQSRRFPLSQETHTVASHVNLTVKDQHMSNRLQTIRGRAYGAQGSGKVVTCCWTQRQNAPSLGRIQQLHWAWLGWFSQYR
ncbi:hypothetical protein T10_4296 [Trichinella papuae]|uniref:Uncharacterized protein n=1 Tax=Trichinella papuae TaxID=268474 RepID=A0A0V1NA71_9BILA|nr:hypothetical protein T10_4296 [Trichinella papuae]